MRIIICLMAIALVSSCHPREFKTIRNFSPVDKKKITLDDTYQFFVREIYKESTDQNHSLTSEKEKTDSSRKELIEIEYIFYSENHDKILYITTIPDRYQKYYSTRHLPEVQLNARDFRTFHFGKLKATGRADYKTYKKNTTYTWQYDIRQDSFSIRRIIETKNGIYQNERSVENSVYQGARFRRVKSFEFVYKDNKKDTTLLKMKDPTLYVSKKKRKYSVYLNFDSPVPLRNMKKLFHQSKKGEDENGNEFTTIIFKGSNNIPYTPDPIVE